MYFLRLAWAAVSAALVATLVVLVVEIDVSDHDDDPGHTGPAPSSVVPADHPGFRT